MKNAAEPKYLVVVEKASDGSYSAFVPDLPGCVSCGESLDDLRGMIQEAIDFHLDGMRAAGLPIPEPSTTADYVTASAAHG